MIKLDPESVGVMSDEELIQAHTALLSLGLRPLDEIEHERIDRNRTLANVSRSGRLKPYLNASWERQEHKRAVIWALSDDELSERLKLRPNDENLIQEHNQRAGRRKGKHTRALMKQIRPRTCGPTGSICRPDGRGLRNALCASPKISQQDLIRLFPRPLCAFLQCQYLLISMSAPIAASWNSREAGQTRGEARSAMASAGGGADIPTTSLSELRMSSERLAFRNSNPRPPAVGTAPARLCLGYVFGRALIDIGSIDDSLRDAHSDEVGRGFRAKAAACTD
jgi:hypothetical protein